MAWLPIETWGGGVQGGGMQIPVSQNKMLKKNWVTRKSQACKDEPVKI